MSNQIKNMVNRFLGWKLPAAFGPDCYISFDAAMASANNSWPIGTNLLSADQAEEMLRYVMEGQIFEMNFGQAIEALKAGKKVARAGWNGKGMWLMFVPAELAEAVSFQFAALNSLPWIGMKTADDCFVPWLASQTDMLAEDWLIVE